MKKRVSVKTKKTTKKTAKKPQRVVSKKSTVAAVTTSVVVNKTPRSFWGLFPSVKNHNFKLMMQEGNYLQDFVKLIEEMPEGQFQYLLNNEQLNYKYGEDYNNYVEYLKEHRLDKYEVEIQHLRYLIKLEQKGVQVPTSYTIDEFFKRSGAPNNPTQVNSTTPIKTALGVSEVVVKDEAVKMTQSPVEMSPEENKLNELFSKYESKDKDTSLGNIIKKFSEQRKEEEKHGFIRPPLTELAANETDKHLREAFAKNEENSFNVDQESDVSRLSELVEKRLEEVKQKESSTERINQSMLKSALQTIAGYANTLEGSFPKTTVETSLPPFWEELKSARELFDKFDDFYAKKQVEAVAATRKMNQEKDKFLKLPEGHDYLTSLHQDTKQHLKTERELKVLKKVLKAAYRDFAQVKTTQADPAYLAAEMSRYTSGPTASSNKFEGLFDHLIPNTEVYERAISRRPKGLLFPLRNQLDKNKPKEAYVVESQTPEWVKQEEAASRTATEIVEGAPDLFTKEGRAEYRRQAMAKRDAIKLFEQQKQIADDAWTYGVDSKGESESALMPNLIKRCLDMHTYSKAEEKMAEEIQKYVAAGDVDPSKDFDKLISYGMDKNSIDCWKHKYAKKLVKE